MVRFIGYLGLVLGFWGVLTSTILFIQRQQPSTAEWIFFSSVLGNQSNIYRYNPHTDELDQLTYTSQQETLVTADAAGRHLHLLVVVDYVNVEAYSIDLNGWNWRRLDISPRDEVDVYPYERSPDGQWLVTTYLVNEANTELFLRDTQSSNMVPLTTSEDISELAPTWSPDGQWIAFIPYDSIHWSLAKVRPDNTDYTELFDLGGQTIERPIWLPPIDEDWHDLSIWVASLVLFIAALLLTIGLTWYNFSTSSTA